MEAYMGKDCSALGGLFQTIMNDMKASYPTWEDFISKAIKLQSQLRTMTLVTGSFLDAFQKIADMAINTRGATKEIGSALTRMCMRHRNIESRLKHLTAALSDSLINPLEGKIEEWKKIANQLDKDHAKEYKKARAEIKKKSSDTIKLQKKVKKGKDDVRLQLDSALQDMSDKYALLEETEKRAVSRALIEERGRFCMFVSFLRPVLNEEIGMLGEITHLQTILEDLINLTAEPNKLPPLSEQVIHDLKNSDYNYIYQTPPASPSGTLSRKASTNSYMHGSMRHVPSMDSISSSMETLHIRPPSTMMLETMFQDPKLSINAQMMAQSASSSPTEENGKPNQTNDGFRLPPPAVMAKPKIPREHLALALSQGLNSEIQLSRDSLHCSSGYSTQTTTPSCSDDTIPSHVADYDYISLHGEQVETDQLDFDKSSTIPRNSDISQNYRRMFQAKRPASTVSLLAEPDPLVRSPHIATIKRNPSNKPPVRRGTVSGVPIPIRTPVVPVKTPTLPDAAVSPFGERTHIERFSYLQDPRSDFSHVRQGLCGSAQSLNAIQNAYCAFIPKQSYSCSQSINPLPQNAQKVSGSSSVTVDYTPVNNSVVPSALPEAISIDNQVYISSEQISSEDDMLSMIRRGVRLRKTISNDRSAPAMK
ncbi:PREDICTED: MTSS1-like protein isoform X2 [Nanorana parkeri]|uniref:MTSS1-like protein isoform X2 n=1 Tax=Nanorana parkeri TaxID=125878 RepID=UPI000854533D|nr:PREDICTED: MTSS1-like protein isoform X2 [Nanorana parkeri]